MVIPAQLDGPKRRRRNLVEPVGSPNLMSNCWFNAAAQLLACLDVPLATTDNHEDAPKDDLLASMRLLLESMKTTTSAVVQWSLVETALKQTGLDLHCHQDPTEFLQKK
jgi:hypothetical protein